jgi:hypothetical protein
MCPFAVYGHVKRTGEQRGGRKPAGFASVNARICQDNRPDYACGRLNVNGVHLLFQFSLFLCFLQIIKFQLLSLASSQERRAWAEREI